MVVDDIVFVLYKRGLCYFFGQNQIKWKAITLKYSIIPSMSL